MGAEPSLSPISLPLLAYARARSLGYTLEARIMFMLGSLLPGAAPPEIAEGEIMELIQKSMKELFLNDISCIENGTYPLSVLSPGSPIRHLKRIPWIVLDGVQAHFRRTKGRTT